MVYPNKINMREMLDEFFDEKVKKYGIGENDVEIIWRYYSLYGKDNRLGVCYKNGCIIYTDKNGNRVKKELLSKAKQRLDSLETKSRETTQEKPKLEVESRLIEKRISRTDRFNARFAKTQEINKGKEDSITEENSLKVD